MKKQIVASGIAALWVSLAMPAMAQRNPADTEGGGQGQQQARPTLPHNDWHNGQRIPSRYRHGNFVMNDWQSHNLDTPSRGQKWLGVNGDYVLVTTRDWKVVKVVPGAPQ